MNPSEFERNKPVKTYQKIKELEKLIKEEQIKTENLYANRIATLDTMLKSVHDLMESFKKGE
jgi:biotin synthase-related radical SAM superfamily protein